MPFASGSGGCQSKDNIHARHPHVQERWNVSDNQVQCLGHWSPSPPHSYQEMRTYLELKGKLGPKSKIQPQQI